jgi:sugar/nucleoside kinase (ribokinase family)
MKSGFSLRPPAAAGFDVVTLGENSVDTMVVVPAGPIDGGKHHALSMADLPGGQAATAAVACARLRWRARYVGAIGGDAPGALVRDTLRHEGVDVVLATRPGVPTRRAVVLVDAATGDRRVIEHRDPRLTLTPDDIPGPIYADARILLVDGTNMAESTRAAGIARASGVRTIADIDRPAEGLADLLRLIDIIVVPETAVAALTGHGDVGRGLAEIGQETRATAVIATCGADGAVAWTEAGEIRAPGCRVVVADTTGAGDAFRAGLAAGWLGRRDREPGLAELLADANYVGAQNCRGIGAQTALPTVSEAPAHLRGPV